MIFTGAFTQGDIESGDCLFVVFLKQRQHMWQKFLSMTELKSNRQKSKIQQKHPPSDPPEFKASNRCLEVEQLSLRLTLLHLPEHPGCVWRLDTGLLCR